MPIKKHMSGWIAFIMVMNAPLYAAPQTDTMPLSEPASITWSELEKHRPADSFRMVYAEDKAVCNTILDALNEKGYDSRYFNVSPKITYPLPELILQTRLNIPRKLLGTHLFRTEEFEIAYTDDSGKPHKDYWYRFIGQGYGNFALATGVKESYTAKHSAPYTDFIEFRLTAFPARAGCENCPFWLDPDGFGTQTRWRYASRGKYWRNESFDGWRRVQYQVEHGDSCDRGRKDTCNYDKASYSFFEEVIKVNQDYYLLSTLQYPDPDKPLRVVATLFDYWHGNYQSEINMHAVCFMESNFILKGDAA